MHQALKKPVILFALLTLALSGCSKTKPSYPVTERKPVVDEYYGIKVIDNYRWLDDVNNPAVRTWVDAQNALSRAYFDKTSSLAAIRDRLQKLYGSQSGEYSSLSLSKKLFALKSQPPREQKFLVVMDSPEDQQSERIVVDPNQLNPDGTTAIDWFAPSGDASHVAVVLSENGSENGAAHVFDVATGEELDVVPRVQYPTGGGSLEWDRDGKGFFYTRYPQGDERPKNEMNFYQQVYYHKLGTPAPEDTYVIGKDFPKIAEIRISSGDNGRYLLVKVANGDGGEFMHYLRGPDGVWKQITQFSDKISLTSFGEKGMLYLLSRKDAPKGKILTMPASKPNLPEAKTFVPESDVSISDFSLGKKYLYVVDMVGGPSQVRVVDLATKKVKTIPRRPNSSVTDFILLNGDKLLFRSETYLDPPSWYRYNPVDGSVVATALGTPQTAVLGDAEVVREFAVSKDGTKIPMDIIRRKGTLLTGKNPTILYGYGGYGINLVPEFRANRQLWVEQGGVYVIAHLRGGAEFGEAWHSQGNLTRKQNVFDDFAACAQYLISSHYTDASKLAIEGQSNGGLLMGSALTQHPELFRAVVSRVGIYDMLRSELFPNGEFNTTEFGSVKDPEQFKALFAYSPYHHVIDGTAYPAILFMTGDHDGRVDPANSRRMIARLQAASTSSLPLLLRTNPHAGHGFGTALGDRIAQDADMFAFLFDQLAVEYKPMSIPRKGVE